MGYKLNGNDLTRENGCLPTNHQITYTQMQTVETIGGTILIEPPGGIKRVHTWNYDARSTDAVRQLLAFLDFESSPVSLIDTYDVIQNTDGSHPILTNLYVVVQKPEIRTANRRSLTEAFSLVFTELYPQS